MSDEMGMRPIDFVVFDGDSTPNVPAHRVAEAMMKPIIINTDDDSYHIVGYYLNDDGVMVLEIESNDDDGLYEL